MLLESAHFCLFFVLSLRYRCGVCDVCLLLFGASVVVTMSLSYQSIALKIEALDKIIYTFTYILDGNNNIVPQIINKSVINHQ